MEPEDQKSCSRCKVKKYLISEFYVYQGKWRSECKACTIKKNVDYQKKTKAWKHRFVDREGRRSYMVEYYARNREKFAEYRKKLKKKYPKYYRDYARRKKTI